MEPPLADRLELAIGILCSLTANINRDSKRRPEPFTAQDFIAPWDRRLEEARNAEARNEEPDEVMTPDQILSGFEKMIERQEKRGVRYRV